MNANTLSTLQFENTSIEVVDRNGRRWLPAASIAAAIGYKRQDAVAKIYRRNADEFTSEMTQVIDVPVNPNLASSEKLKNSIRIFSPRGAHLIAMFARTDKAKKFRKWVLDVLDTTAAQATTPSAPSAELTYEEVMDRALAMSQARMKALREEREALTTQVEQLAPKAEALNTIANTSGNLCITDAAKVLQTKPKALFEWLHEHKWIYRRVGSGWLAFQCRIDQGVMQHKVVTTYAAGVAKIREQALITPKGLTKLAEAFALKVEK